MPLNLSRHSLLARSVSRLAETFSRFERRCGRDRGGMAVLCAVLIPALVGLGTLAIDQGYYGYRSLLLKQTTQNAALAAAQVISSYYSTGSSSTVVSTAQSFATANMPTTQYGTVVTSGNVVLGTWSGTSFTGGGTSPNAVQVTGLNTSANNNPVELFLGSFFGRPTADVSYTAVASYGTGKPFNTIVINDMSQSFAGQISDQLAADLQILNCVKGATGSSSYFGITFINGHSHIYQPLTLAGANLTLLQTLINALTACTALIDPNCSTGSNVASGLYSAIQQFNSATYTGTSKNVVIITDGAPDASKGVTYSAADGLTCTTNCTIAQMEADAQTQAALAKAAGINVSTIYYSGTDTNPTDQAAYKAFLASLVTGTGIGMVAPTAAQLDKAYSGFCSTIPPALKLAN